MANQNQFSILKIRIFRQIVPLIFPSDDEGRAKSAEFFSNIANVYLMDSISRLRDNAFLVRRTQTARPFRVFW